MTVAVLFNRLGPYHHARLAAAGRQMRVVAVEFTGVDKMYAWDSVPGANKFERRTLFPNTDPSRISSARIRADVATVLSDIRADVVAVNGWAARSALSALHWCAVTGTPSVLMSESHGVSPLRNWVFSWPKKRIARLFTTALVSGRPQMEYFARLRGSSEDIFTGYGVVDNEHFSSGSDTARLSGCRATLRLPDRYFLASSRFAEMKNLRKLLRGFAAYHRLAGPAFRWDLVLLGEGHLRSVLESDIRMLGIGNSVFLPGFKQYDELPAYYGLSQAFVHASTYEPWGLVVNEAMAAGLPVLVSDRCGCCADLVVEGRNGYSFNPQDEHAIAESLRKVATLDEVGRAAMGVKSRAIIQDWGTARFADGLARAAKRALASRPISPHQGDLMLVRTVLGLSRA